MTATCGHEVDFHEDGCVTHCDRPIGHPGWHSFSGASAILSWADR